MAVVVQVVPGISVRPIVQVPEVPVTFAVAYLLISTIILLFNNKSYLLNIMIEFHGVNFEINTL